MIFPVPVTLKRLAAPLCVFNFWFMLFLESLSFLRSEDGDQIRSFHFGSRFHDSHFGQFFNQAIDNGSTDALMNDFASSEEYRRLDFVSLGQEADDVILLEDVIVFVRIRTKLHFLDRDVFLMLLGFVKLLVHLVEVLSVIHDPAHRRNCRGRYLYQVQAPLFGDLYGRLRRHDSELLVLVVDDTHFARPDSLVHPNVFVDGSDLLNGHMRQTFTLTKYRTSFQLARAFGWL